MCVFSTQYKDTTFFNNVHHIFNIWGGQRVNAASGQCVREIFQNCAQSGCGIWDYMNVQ